MSTKLYITPESGPERGVTSLRRLVQVASRSTSSRPSSPIALEVWHPVRVRDLPPEIIALLDVALDEYWEMLNDTDLATRSVEDYYYFAFCFVRWCRGEFEPGAHVR